MYKRAIKTSNGDKHILSHSYFNLAYLNLIGNGTLTNVTKFDSFLNISIKHDPDFSIPSTVMRFYANFNMETINISDMLEIVLSKLTNLFNFTTLSISLSCLIFYCIFFISLSLQK